MELRKGMGFMVFAERGVSYVDGISHMIDVGARGETRREEKS